MKFVPSSQAVTYTNAASLFGAVEYHVGDKDIDCAFVKINGQYPGNGKFAVNTKAKEMIFCAEVSGVLEMKSGEKRNFNKNDVILIEIGEVYRFDATCSLVVCCTPPWTPEQHQKVD